MSKGSVTNTFVRRTHIPKPGTDKLRPLGILCFDDKVVNLATTRVLEQIYEADFLDCSYGYRPGRTQHQALDQLARTIQQRKINFIVEADIKGDLKPADRFYSLKDVDRSVARQNPLPGSGESKSRSWRLRDSWPLAFMIPLLLATEWLIHRLKL